MSNIVVGATVRIGNGKVEYVVDKIDGGKAFVIGAKSSRSVDVAKLVFVSGPVTEEAKELSLSDHNERAETLPNGVFLLIDGEDPVQYKSFDRAAFELSRNHTYRFATIVNDNGVTVQRKRVA
jgi:hypothetical protein